VFVRVVTALVDFQSTGSFGIIRCSRETVFYTLTDFRCRDSYESIIF